MNSCPRWALEDKEIIVINDCDPNSLINLVDFKNPKLLILDVKNFNSEMYVVLIKFLIKIIPPVSDEEYCEFQEINFQQYI